MKIRQGDLVHVIRGKDRKYDESEYRAERQSDRQNQKSERAER